MRKEMRTMRHWPVTLWCLRDMSEDSTGLRQARILWFLAGFSAKSDVVIKLSYMAKRKILFFHEI
ncbi:hypothetical protein [Janthinobacterium sp. LB2P10]|uniref:hypothetical protein n=1 Tax=Janthinobacterium sp. LB2P10 TaxID=3424194 RepID=UPI003F25CDD9